MFGRNVTLFEVFGFKVRINITWAFLALLVGLSLAQGFFPGLYAGLPTAAYWWMAVVAVIGLLISIVLHELAHALVARQFGLEMRGITLFMFGGMAEMEDEPATPKAEALMAIAGPIMSLLLAALFYGAAGLARMAEAGTPAVAVLGYLGFLNLVLAIFNMVPAYPLDGGRVLRAGLWAWRGDMRAATRLAARIGAIFGYVLAGLGVLSALAGNIGGGLWWVLIGLFIAAAARGSYYQLETRRILQDEPVRRFMTPDPVAVPAHITVQELVDGYVYRHFHDFFPVVEQGRLLGGVGLREIKTVPREEWSVYDVSRILVPSGETNAIDADADAVQALSVMQRSGNSRLMVTEGGRLVGVVALKDLMRLLSLKMDLESGGGGAARRLAGRAEAAGR